MNPQNPTTPLDPTAGDTSDAPVTPMPGEAIQPTVAQDMSQPAPAPEPMTTSLDPAMVASDPSPLDQMTPDPMPEPVLAQPPQPTEAMPSEPSMQPQMPPTPEPAIQATPVAPEPQQVTVTVEQQPPASSGSSVPSFLSQPKPAEPAPVAQQPAMPTPTPTGNDATSALPPVVVHTGKKSRLLIFVIVLVVLLAGGGAAAYFLTRKDKPTSDTSSSANSSQSDTTKTDSNKTDSPAPAAEAVTAKYASDFDAVCEGKSVANAAAYTDNKSAVVFAFRTKPLNPDSWSSVLVGYGKSYYLEDLDKFTDINTVVCLKHDDSNSGQGISCDYKNTQGATVTVAYKPLKYTMTIHEAKTGKQIGDSQIIDGPATECPSSVLYDQDTKTAYADPNEDAVEAALDKFVQ